MATIRITKENFEAKAKEELAIKVTGWKRDFLGGIIRYYRSADFELAEDARRFADEIKGHYRDVKVSDRNVTTPSERKPRCLRRG